MAAIRTESLSKTYAGSWRQGGTEALRSLNLEVREGEVFGFLGPNGAGKSTTIHLLLNFVRPSAGKALLFDRPATDTKTHRRIGYLPESVNLHDYYRGAQLLEFYGALLGMPKDACRLRVAEVLSELRLEAAAEKPVSTYSKGMLQRLGLAQALLNDPDLLILDEPNSNLDPIGRKEFREILLARKQRGKTVFISSHILSEVESVCDRVAILQQGRLLRVGTLQELSSAGRTKFFVTRPPAVILEALTATAARLTIEGGQVTILCHDEALRRQVEQVLSQHQITADRVEAEARPLEEIFFSTIHQAPPS